MAHDRIRIGFVGAGSIARQRHLPGLAQLEGVEVVAVCNRSTESGNTVAEEFGIAEVADDWRKLVEKPDIDALFIGTWPYTHRDMSVAALQAGKHVFCQARMAMDLAEAREMVEASRARPDLVAMICPPPHRMPFEPYIKELIAQGRLGKIELVEVRSLSGANLDAASFTWREDVAKSGKQVLAAGIYAETINAWLGPYEELLAYTATPIREKTGPDGKRVAVHIPQIVTVSGRLQSGALVTEQHSGVSADHAQEIVIRGRKGSLRRRFNGDVLELALPGGEFEPVDVPAANLRPWRVEEEFIDAVRAARRGESWSVSPDFEEGLMYMRKIEAIHESARTGAVVRPEELR